MDGRFQPVKRACLLFPSGPADNVYQLHLFVLLNDPWGPANQVLIVPITSLKPTQCDKTCVLTAGTHPFIQHDSYVSYRHARVEPAEVLSRGVERNQFVDKGLLDDAVFARVVQGLRASRFTKPFAKHFLDQVEGVRK